MKSFWTCEARLNKWLTSFAEDFPSMFEHKTFCIIFNNLVECGSRRQRRDQTGCDLHQSGTKFSRKHSENLVNFSKKEKNLAVYLIHRFKSYFTVCLHPSTLFGIKVTKKNKIQSLFIRSAAKSATPSARTSTNICRQHELKLIGKSIDEWFMFAVRREASTQFRPLTPFRPNTFLCN